MGKGGGMITTHYDDNNDYDEERNGTPAPPK